MNSGLPPVESEPELSGCRNEEVVLYWNIDLIRGPKDIHTVTYNIFFPGWPRLKAMIQKIDKSAPLTWEKYNMNI